MRNFWNSFARALLFMTPAIALAGCTTSARAPVNALQLNEVVIDLPGTKGKTLEDQRRIDRTIAKSCTSGILGSIQCDLQTRASAERRGELKQNGG